MERKLYYLSGIVILAMLVIAVGYEYQQNQHRNGFYRNLERIDLEIEQVYRLPHERLYFAGQSATGWYFRNQQTGSANALFSIDYGLNYFMEHRLDLPRGVATKRNLGVTDSIIYLTENQTGSLCVWRNSKLENTKPAKPGHWFDQTCLLSANSIAGRKIALADSQLRINLMKFNYATNEVSGSYTLERQDSEIFVNDGMLRYDAAHLKLYYLYFNLGQFICLDTNLNLRYKSNTVDTVRKVQGEMAKTTRKGKVVFTQRKVPKMVNRNFTVQDNKVFILSALHADNENYLDYRGMQAVDVYAADMGTYLFSFYIPEYKGQRLREFRINGNSLYGIYGADLVKYAIRHNNKLLY